MAEPNASDVASEAVFHGQRTSNHERSPSEQLSGIFRESLHAFSQEMSDGSRKLNQYRIRGVIGHGSYGMVHLGELIENPSTKLAIKEFVKARLRRFRLIEKQRRGDHKPRTPALKPHDCVLAHSEYASSDPLFLIRPEIAIMKRMRHPNVVRLYEVLDDPINQLIYMVFEYCGDGPVIRMRGNEAVERLSDEHAHNYFIQILQGVDYLHANGIVHRDIKPDNLLLTDNARVCKIVDFGVSEMFDRENDTMYHAVGSPAFMSPALSANVSRATHGRSDDIWALGVTLYVMLAGFLPFNYENVVDMANAITHKEPEYPSYISPDACDLLKRMLNKNEDERITARDILDHPWVTRHGKIQIEPAAAVKHSSFSEEELQCAVRRISSMFVVARAVSKFKRSGNREKKRKSTPIPTESEHDPKCDHHSHSDSERADGKTLTPVTMPAEARAQAGAGEPTPERLTPLKIPDDNDMSSDPVMLHGMPLCDSP